MEKETTLHPFVIALLLAGVLGLCLFWFDEEFTEEQEALKRELGWVKAKLAHLQGENLS